MTCSQRSRPNFRGSRRRPFVPRLELLEDRTVPSTLTVANNLDNGAGSLRAALAAAHNGDTIAFAGGLKGSTIALTSGALHVTASVTITGPGAGMLTVDGTSHGSVFDIAAGAKVTISGLTLAHGLAAAGGGIDNAGNLTLTHDTLLSNWALGGIGGGGIFNEAGASLSLNSVLLQANRASTTAGNDVFGGALLNEGSANVINSTFQNNQAVGGGTGDFFGGPVGGAIDNYNGAMLLVTGSTFTGNEAVSAAGPYAASGGAIENDAGFPDAKGNFTHPSTAYISDSTFTGNQAVGVAGAIANGGALDNQGTGATMFVTNCTLSGNRALGGDGGTASSNGEGLGGGILNVLDATLVVDDSRLTGNKAVGGNNGTPVDTDLPFGPSVGGGQGGGILNGDATAVIISTTLADNEAVGGSNATGPGSFATGGGIENFGTALAGQPDVLRVINSTLNGNEAIAGHGGPGATGATGVPTGFAAGGGIDDAFSGTAFVVDSTLTGNAAVGGAGGQSQPGGAALGGGIAVGFTTLFGMTDNSTLELTDSTLTGNAAVGGAGGNVLVIVDPPVSPLLAIVGGGVGGEGLGGGLAVTAGSSATVDDTTIEANYAYGGAAGTGLGGTPGQGTSGGVYDVGTVTLDMASVVANNHATTGNNNMFP